MDERVGIRAHYERFPATLKGAFVLRGEDADPHQVRLESARVAEMAGRSERPLEVEPATLDVARSLLLTIAAFDCVLGRAMRPPLKTKKAPGGGTSPSEATSPHRPRQPSRLRGYADAPE